MLDLKAYHAASSCRHCGRDVCEELKFARFGASRASRSSARARVVQDDLQPFEDGGEAMIGGNSEDKSLIGGLQTPSELKYLVAGWKRREGEEGV